MQNYNTVYREVNEYHKKWQTYPHDAAEWEQAAADAARIAARHGKDRFLRQMLLAVYNELEQQYTKGGTNHEGDNSS